VRVFTTTDPNADAESSVSRYDSLAFWAYPQLRVAIPGTRLAADLRNWRPTLVHAATPFGVGLAARAAARALGVRLVTSYHTSLSAYARFYQLGALAQPCWSFLRWFHNSGAATFVPSRPVADELRIRGFTALRLWERGVDCHVFHPRHRSLELRRSLGFSDADVVVLYVGRLAREKGLDDLVAAMHLSRAAEPRIRYLIVGDGPYAGDLRAAAPNDAVFAGRRQGQQLAEMYASSDMFVFTSVTDTFGNVLLEAMASGLAIVAADAAASRTLLQSSALFYRGKNAHQLAAVIAHIAARADERCHRGSLGLREASQRSWARVFDGLFDNYAEVLQRGYLTGSGPWRRSVTRAQARGCPTRL
jgi:glycosyltransferase involved in cell wall biosynthesis